MSARMRILYLAAEAAPFVKVGGLADVAGSLPWALRALPEKLVGPSGPDVRLAIPFHSQIDDQAYDFTPVAAFQVPHAGGAIPARVFEVDWKGVRVYLVDGPPFEGKQPLYSSDATRDGLKYTFFSLAMLELIRILNWVPDVLHVNDWHTAPAVYAVALNRLHRTFYSEMATLITVHSLPYLGQGAQSALEAFGLPPDFRRVLPGWANQLPLPLGLLTADHITTVSPTYAKQILTPEFGAGLEDFLKAWRERLTGILNGIDTALWDPATDEHIDVNYSLENIENRTENKLALQAKLRFEQDPDIPLLSFIGRMDHQKGVDVILQALPMIANLPWQAVILGTGDKELEKGVRDLAASYPDKVKAVLRYDEALAHRIYAGADAIMIPSRYEPCGLIQMIAMRYGCIPVANATGGLKDTIKDYKSARSGTGFLFDAPTPEALAEALHKALDVFANQRRWRSLQRRAMREDFSWKGPAAEYYRLYQTLVQTRSGTHQMEIGI